MMGSADQLISNGPAQQLDSRTNSRMSVDSRSRHVIGDGAPREHCCPPAVKKIIERTRLSGGQILDLSRQNLSEIPMSVLGLHSIEYLYLEGNNISRLPDEFFDHLSNLKWLDLRNNQLLYLPSMFLGRHRNLKTLLLQGNKLRTLPLELGMIPTLKGLSWSGNPLEFPPADIVALGTDSLLRYLREALLQKSEGKAILEASDLDTMTQLSIRDNDDDSGASCSDSDLPRQPVTSPVPPVSNNTDDDLGVQPRQAALHRPVSYYQIKQQHMERVKKAGASGKVSVEKGSAHSNTRGKSSTSDGSIKSRHPHITPYPEPPPLSLIEDRAREDSRIKRIKKIKEQQEFVLQKRRNEEVLKDFRQEAKQLQNRKYRQLMKRGEDFDDTASVAPYGFQLDYATVRDKEELIKHEVRLAHERMSRPMSPGTKERLENERALRDRNLEKRVKDHTSSMVERRRKSRGTAAEEMEAARREMEIGLMLERELQQRRKELEYRFQAFTAEVPEARVNNGQINLRFSNK